MNNKPSDRELLAKLTEIIVEALLVSPDEVTPEARLFSDLKAESIDIVDIRFRTEHAFGFKIDQNAMMRSLGEGLSSTELDGRFTVGFLIDYIKNRLASAEQPT
ncbi:MAG: acyl carrier protein [Acidiferrobacterales bacterium]